MYPWLLSPFLAINIAMLLWLSAINSVGCILVITAKKPVSAIIYEKNDLSSYSKLKAVIAKAFDDVEIKKAAQRTSGILSSRPFSPQELLVKHVELAAKFGNIPNLTPTGRQFSFVQYHNVDVFLLAFAVPLMIMVILAYIVKRCVSSRVQKKEKRQ